MMKTLRPPCRALRFSWESSVGYPGDQGWEGRRPVRQPGKTGFPRGRRPDKALPVPAAGAPLCRSLGSSPAQQETPS